MANEQTNPVAATSVLAGLVRFSYAHIWEAKAITPGQDAKFSMSIIIPKSNPKLLTQIREAIDRAAQIDIVKLGGKIPPGLKQPLRDGDADPNKVGDPNYKNCYFLNASSKTAPGIVDINKKPITNQSEVYSGCYGYVSLNFYAFNTNGNKGIAAGLNNIMKVKNGEALGGRQSAEHDFGAMEVNYEDNGGFEIDSDLL